MMNWDTTVRVFIPRAVLQGEGAPLTEGQFFKRFNEFRDVYEIVAKETFAGDQFKAMMIIERADIARYLSGRQP